MSFVDYLVHDAIELVRWLLLFATAWNLCWTWRGPRDLARQRVWPTSWYQSVMFFFTGGTFLFQFAIATGWRYPPPAPHMSSLFGLTMLLVASILLALGRVMGKNFDKVFFVYQHMGVALAIAKLDEVDPEAAAEVARNCRSEVAKRTSGAVEP